MENMKLRERAKIKRVALWEIAEALGISEPTFSRWMRSPLSQEVEKKAFEAIERIVTERAKL